MTTKQAALRHLRASDPLDELDAVLEEDGAVVVENFLPPETVAALNAEIDAYVAAADPAMRHLNPAIEWFHGSRTRHVAALAGKSRTFVDEVMLHPIFLGLSDRVVLPQCAEYVLNLGHVIERGPGAEQQLLHRDEYTWVNVPGLGPASRLQLASMVALRDFDETNGATHLAPGSHRWEDRARVPEPHELVQAVMPAGSAAIYLGWTIHGAGANTTGTGTTEADWRRGLHVSYCAGWLRTEENNVLGCPPDVARTLPVRAQELLGYGVHDAIQFGGGYVGMLELRRPTELLADGSL
jgi:ectoine hydroxylase-related dioxygenase (phytanoyl-CoA dioxygenase family)